MSKIYGPNGQPVTPVSMQGAHIIGAPKSFDDLTPEPYSEETLDSVIREFGSRMLEVVTQLMGQTGLPQADVYKAPAMVPMGPLTLIRVAKTLQQQRLQIKELQAKVEALGGNK